MYATDDKLCLAHVIYQGEKPVLTLCKEIPLTSDKNRQKLLENELSKLDLEDINVNYVLAPADYKLFLVEAPQVEASEMASAAKWKIKDLVESPVEELAIVVFPVPDDAYRGQNQKVYAVAAKKSRIREVVDMMDKCGLSLDAIDIPEMAMINLSRTFSDDSSGLAFIDLRDDGSTLNLCKEGKIYLTRHLNTRVDPGILKSRDWDTVKEKLVLEIQRSLDYYESQMGQMPITHVLVTPRGDETELLVKELNAAMGVEVTALEVDESFATADSLAAALAPSGILAIGGALRTEQVAA